MKDILMKMKDFQQNLEQSCSKKMRWSWWITEIRFGEYAILYNYIEDDSYNSGVQSIFN